jgi:hypothetical protein
MKPTIVNKADAVVPAELRNGHQEDRRHARRPADTQGEAGHTSREAMAEATPAEAYSLKVAARDYIWLYDVRHGVAPNEIAARSGVSVRQVRKALERARAMERSRFKDNLIESFTSGRLDGMNFRLFPLFPVAAYTPQSACPHPDSFELGSRLCCMVCHTSGMDDHPGFRRDPETDPAPEPRSKPVADAAAPSKVRKSKETRKQRRRRQLVAASVA